MNGFKTVLASYDFIVVGGGMTGLLRLLYENGASEVKAVRVAESGTVSDYTAAFRALAESDSARIVVTDSALTEVHQALRSHVETASENRRERIAIVGGSGTLFGCLLGTALIVTVENSMILIGIPTVWKDVFVGALIVIGTGISAMQVTRANRAGMRNLKREAVK